MEENKENLNQDQSLEPNLTPVQSPTSNQHSSTSEAPKDKSKSKINLSYLILAIVICFILIVTIVALKIFNRQISSKKTPNKLSNIAVLKDFPIYSGATFVNIDPKVTCPTGVQTSPCNDDFYNFKTSDIFKKVYDFYQNKTINGWVCVGGAGNIDPSDSARGDVTTKCTKNNTSFDLGYTGNKDGTSIHIGVPVISPTSDPTANPDSIKTNWKTYTSKDGSFTFKYPVDLDSISYANPDPGGEVIISKHSCTGCGGGLTGISVIILANPNSLSLQDYINQHAAAYNDTPFIKGDSGLGITNDFMIDRTAPGAGPAQIALIAKDKNIVELYCGSCSDSVTDQILSTFKFTDQNQSSSIPSLYSGVQWNEPQHTTGQMGDQKSDMKITIIYSKPIQSIPQEMFTYYKTELDKRGWKYNMNLTTEGGFNSGNGADGWSKDGKYFYVGAKYNQQVFLQYNQ